MINIVQAIFPVEAPRRNTGSRGALERMLAAVAALPVLLAFDAVAADAVRPRSCDPLAECPGRRPPGDPDRDARPFEGTLGRPCTYRPRFTPSGTRRVRVCY